MEQQEWSIQQLSRLGGTSSRTLRHYHDIGLVKPSRIGRNGYRYYDQSALVQLQRVLLLRELGLTLRRIADIVDQQTDEVAALTEHLELLRRDQRRLSRRIAAVQTTIEALREDTPLMAEQMFDGFDPGEYREEVERRWGAASFRRGDEWWRSMGDDERVAWQERSAQLTRDWLAAAADPGTTCESSAAKALARRHVAWLETIPGTPASDPEADTDAYLRGLAEMYVDDERFATAYGGQQGAQFVRDSLLAYLDGGE